MENNSGKSKINSLYNESNILPPPIPPPPPPPPPLPVYQKNKTLEPLNSLNLNNNNSVLNEEQTSLAKYSYYFCNENVVSYYRSIHSIIQEGPSCGIVALAMASQLLQATEVSVLLEAAKKLRFSNSGEVFSVYNMAALASSLLNCDATVITSLKTNQDSILSHICRGWPVLIPYDADKNHEPCLNNGLSAHWAVISGLCFGTPESCETSSEIKFESTSTGLKVYFSENGCFVQKLLNLTPRVYVYAHQGKSKHLALWDLDMLLSSNNNLYEVTNKYEFDTLVLPKNQDCLSELRDKAVLLKPKNI